MTKSRAGDVTVHILERGIVEHVVQLGPELQLHGVLAAEIEILVDVPVEVTLAVETVRVAADRAEVAE